MTIRSWTDAEVMDDANLFEMRDSQAKARAYSREIVRLRALMRGMEPLAVAVMAEHDEETTGNVALDNLINGAMALADDVRPPRGGRMSAPEGGCTVKCPVCTRIGPFHVAAGEAIGFCAQCSLGEGRQVRLVLVPAKRSEPKAVHRG